MPRLVPSPNSRNLNERRVDHRDSRQPKTQGQRSADRSTYETFIAKILASPVSVGTNRWRYAWEEVVVKDDHGIATPSAKRASRSTGTAAEFTYALNMCEMCQSISASLVGPGVTVSTIPSGFSLQPIAENTCVVMHAMNRRSGRPLFAFSMPNAIDGTCA
jgi:hypothetical protein